MPANSSAWSILPGKNGSQPNKKDELGGNFLVPRSDRLGRGKLSGLVFQGLVRKQPRQYSKAFPSRQKLVPGLLDARPLGRLGALP
mgnify:CR=1 FL=1